MQKYIFLLVYLLTTSAPAYALIEITEFGTKDSMPKPPIVTLKLIGQALNLKIITSI